jgi:hypothetical protein
MSREASGPPEAPISKGSSGVSGEALGVNMRRFALGSQREAELSAPSALPL